MTQLLGYADDLDLVERNIDVVKEKVTNIKKESGELGLKVNEKRTKYMKTSLSDDRTTSYTLEVNRKHF